VDDIDPAYMYCLEIDSITPNSYSAMIGDGDFLGGAELCYSEGKFLINNHYQCREFGVLDKVHFNERAFIEYFHALTEKDYIDVGIIDPSNITNLPCIPEAVTEVSVYDKVMGRVIIGAELITLAGAAVAVSKYLSGAIGLSVLTALSSFGISTYFNQDESIDGSLAFAGKISHATMKHIAFYEIASNKEYKQMFRDSVIKSIDDWRIKYALDISYFMIGNVASNWISHSLTDLYNELLFEDYCQKLRIEQEPFMYRGPVTAYKRIWKELIRDAVTLPFLYAWGDIDTLKDYAHIRLKENPITLDVTERPENYHYLDDTVVPSLFGHFGANLQVSSWFNGISAYTIAKTFGESTAKYLPEIILSKYVFSGTDSRSVKYFKIFITTTTYNIAKNLLPKWL